MIGIYKITNKLNGKVYIGQSRDIDARWRQHINAKDDVLIHNAIKKYGKENFSFEVLLECPAEMLNDWERDMIALYDCISPKGYNLTEGGGGCKCSEETKIKMSNARKGKTPWNKGKTNIYTEETLLKMSELKKGKNLSEEHKRKISESMKGIHIKKKKKIKISESKKGTHFSEETKKKMSEARKGIPLSEETKIKISESKKGRQLSEEIKKKMSEVKKGRHWKIENGKRIWY